MGQVKQTSLSYKLFISHPHFKNFLLYSFSYLIVGQVLTCLGPILPYLAEYQGGLQTDYSFLFIARAAGFVIGSIFTRIIGNKLTLHQVISVGIILIGIGCILFGQFQNLFFKGFCIFLVSIGCAFKQISINVAALICFNGKNGSSWLQAIHGCLGIGSLLGPILVYIFQLGSLTILGFYTLITLVFYYILQNTENMFGINKIQKQNNKKLQLPKYSLYLVSAAFFFGAGQTTVYGGWISSFIVRWNFSTKQKATFYSSFYWFSIALFRFLMVLVPGTASNKIKYLCFIAIVNSFASYFIIFNIDQQIGLVFMSFMYGLCNSIIFPLLFAISGQFGFQVNVKQSSLFIIWTQIGGGCFGVGVGQLMQWLSYNWLIYSMVFFNIALIYIIIQNTNFLNCLKVQRIKQEGFSDQNNNHRMTVEYIKQKKQKQNKILKQMQVQLMQI